MNEADFRSKVWQTSLGVRAKLTLLAIGALSKFENDEILAPPDVFIQLIPMIGRTLSSVVSAIKRLETQGILKIYPASSGYLLSFHPENEVKFTGKRGRA